MPVSSSDQLIDLLLHGEPVFDLETAAALAKQLSERLAGLGNLVAYIGEGRSRADPTDKSRKVDCRDGLPRGF